MLELIDLAKQFPVIEDDPVRPVDGVSLTVEPGEFIAIYGPSGSGKTTLLNLIAGLIKPDRGQVLFDGLDIASMSTKEADQYRLWDLGIVDRPETLFPGARAISSACLKLWLTNRRDAEKIIEPLLVRLGLASRLRQRTEHLSMGERQRVAIARALALEPKIVLADEPTGSLDSKRTLDVLTLLRELCSERGTVTILATHDETAAAFADRVFELQDGQLLPYTPRRLDGVAQG